jgi:hypothetical protein
MRKICCVLLTMLPLSAFAYPIDVEKHINGVQIDYNSHDTAYDIGNITVNNYGDVPAKCTVVFSNGPEAPRTRRVQIAPKSTTNVTVKFSREIVKLRIKLSCEPQ